MTTAPQVPSSPSATPHRRSRWCCAVVVIALVALTTPVVQPPVAGAAETLTAPQVIGAPCTPDSGVTVVIDTHELTNQVRLGCAPGQQASGLAALDAAGFTITSESGAGTVCTVDGLPAEGYPTCWTVGFWSYWALGAGGTSPSWVLSDIGLGFGPLLPGSAIALSWDNEVAAGDAPAPRLTPEALEARAAVSPDGTAALEWIEAELDDGGGTLPGFGEDSTEWGLTADAALALAAGGRADAAPAKAAIGALAADVAAYVTLDELGEGYEGVRKAGPLAKLLLIAATTESDIADFGGWDLEAEVRALITVDGPQAGRVGDDVGEVAGLTDISNGFSQAYAVLGLAHTDAGVPEPVVSFLLAQQCPAGGFRLVYGTSAGCTADTQIDTDGTAMALHALLAVERTPAVTDALVEGLGWLLANQDAGTGAFGGTGITAGLNANSTGLIAGVLSAAGREAEAAAAANWLRSIQLHPTNAGAALDDVGAVAYNTGAFSTAVTSGVSELSRDQWRRSTTQAVFGLGVAPFARIGSGQPIEPVVLPKPAFTDVPADHPFAPAIAWMVDANITTGYDDNTFRPTANVTRQAVAAFLWRAAGEPHADTTQTFTDVPANHPFAEAIAWMVDTNITTGYDDNTFRPTANVTRQAVAAFLWRAAGEP